jgi:DUF1707 SHOCT-like domain
MTEHRQHQPTTDVAGRPHRDPVGRLRAADTGRQAAVDRLGTALREGRLDLAEYDERLRQAYAAHTYRELGPPTDLPAPTSTGNRSPWGYGGCAVFRSPTGRPSRRSSGSNQPAHKAPPAPLRSRPVRRGCGTPRAG